MSQTITSASPTKKKKKRGPAPSSCDLIFEPRGQINGSPSGPSSGDVRHCRTEPSTTRLRETAGGELFPKPLKNDDCRPRAVGSGMGCRFIASACASACDRPPGGLHLSGVKNSPARRGLHKFCARRKKEHRKGANDDRCTGTERRRCALGWKVRQETSSVSLCQP